MKESSAVVFVIDDDASMRGALENLVSSIGLDVRLFASPPESIQTWPAAKYGQDDCYER